MMIPVAKFSMISLIFRWFLHWRTILFDLFELQRQVTCVIEIVKYHIPFRGSLEAYMTPAFNG